MDYMPDEVDTLTEDIILNDSQALADLEKLVTGVTALNDKFIMLLGTLGETNGQLQTTAEDTQNVSQAETVAEGSTNAFAAALQKAGIALQAAFGLGVYQIINNTLGLIKGGIQDGLDFAQSMFLINSAIDEMRGAGVDVQFQDLSKIVTDLGPKLQAFSNLDLSKAVGQVAALAGQFGVTADQVSTLTEFSAVASERMGTDIVTNATTVSAALENMTTQLSRRIQVMTGAQISSQDIYNEAVLLGIDNGAKTYNNLTNEEKVQAGIAVIEEKRADWQKWEAEYQSTSVGKVKDLGAAWQNLWTGWGIAITNLMPQLTGMFDYVIANLAMVSGYLQTEIDAVKAFMGGNPMDWSQFLAEANANAEQVYKLYTNPSPSQVKGSPTTPSATPLGTPPVTSGLSAQDQLKVEADMEKQIVDLHDSEAAALEKIQTNLGNKLVDITTKYDRALVAEDVQAQNERQKIYDQTAESLATAAEHERLSELEAQQKYQEDLQNLMDSFQANLEDALRARDAKTIIHLIEEYDNQKLEKARQYKDDQTLREENYKQEIEDIKRQEQFNLQELAIQVAERKAALKVQADQEAADAKLNAQRQTDAETVDIANRIKAWEDGLKLQYDITDEQMKNIYNDVNAYLGKNGYIDQIYTYIIERMAQVYAALGAGTDTPLGYGHGNGMAAGGSLFANKPTSVTFGEAGPELAMFLPLGSNFGSPSASFAGGGGGGSLQLQITLDPNLQAQIVQTSLDNVALSIDRMQRQK
jgi:hypothetical protein